MTDDWRLTTQEEYLSGATLVRKPYRVWSETWEHDHCAFCWAKFIDPSHSPEHAAMVRDDPSIQTAGYAAVGAGPEGQDDYHWICDGCFQDFRERFGWIVASET